MTETILPFQRPGDERTMLALTATERAIVTALRSMPHMTEPLLHLLDTHLEEEAEPSAQR